MVKGKTVLLFTGGGETQVLNATILGAVLEAKKRGMRVFGGLQGWASLLGGRIIDLGPLDLEGIQYIGGTFLRTSRTNPLADPRDPARLMKRMADLGIDFLLPIGGDDTLGAASALWDDFKVPIVAAPKTADNDLGSTHFTPGFPSAAWELASMVNRLKRDCAIPRHRAYIIESQGGKAGWLPAAGALGGAHMVIVPEHPVKIKDVLSKAKKIFDSEQHLVVVISKESRFDVALGEEEDQGDGFSAGRTQHVAIGLQAHLKKALGASVQTVTPSNFIRSGKGHPVDISLSMDVGRHAIHLIAEGKLGTMSNVVHDGKRLTTGHVTLREAASKKSYRCLPDDYYSPEALLPTEEYLHYLSTIFGKTDFGDRWYYALMEEVFDGSNL